MPADGSPRRPPPLWTSYAAASATEPSGREEAEAPAPAAATHASGRRPPTLRAPARRPGQPHSPARASSHRRAPTLSALTSNPLAQDTQQEAVDDEQTPTPRVQRAPPRLHAQAQAQAAQPRGEKKSPSAGATKAEMRKAQVLWNENPANFHQAACVYLLGGPRTWRA